MFQALLPRVVLLDLARLKRADFLGAGIEGGVDASEKLINCGHDRLYRREIVRGADIGSIHYDNLHSSRFQ